MFLVTLTGKHVRLPPFTWWSQAQWVMWWAWQVPQCRSWSGWGYVDMVVQAPHNVSHSLINGIRLFVNPRYVFSHFEYLFINSNNTSPATSVNVEWVFSYGHLILSHVCNCLSVQSTHALICLGSWSLLGLVKNMDILAITALDDAEGNEEYELEDGWDHI